MDTESLDQNRITANSDFVALLRRAGLDTVGNVMSFPSGRMMRSVPGRSTMRIELLQPKGGKQVAYLKRYEPEYLGAIGRLKRLVRWPGAGDEAAHEWKMITTLIEAGFNTPVPIAFGQSKSGGIVTRSFLITAEISNGEAAHEHLRALRSKPRERRAFLREIGRISRRFHSSGFVHKDFYLSHLFVAPGTRSTEPVFHLIDLQRLARPRLFRRRWLIKDASQMAYSALLEGATRADLLACYLAYADKARLDDDGREWVRSVWRRVQALQSRGPKYDVIWNKPGVRPKGTLGVQPRSNSRKG